MAEIGWARAYSYALRGAEGPCPAASGTGLALDRVYLTGGQDTDVSRAKTKCTRIQMIGLRFKVNSLDRRPVYITPLQAMARDIRDRLVFAYREKCELVFDDQLVGEYRRKAAKAFSGHVPAADADDIFDLHDGWWLIVREGKTQVSARWAVLVQVGDQPRQGPPAPAPAGPVDERSTGEKSTKGTGVAADHQGDPANGRSFPAPRNEKHREDVLKYLGDPQDAATWDRDKLQRRLLLAYKFQNVAEGRPGLVQNPAVEQAILGKPTGTSKTLSSLEAYLCTKVWPGGGVKPSDPSLGNYLVHHGDITEADVVRARQRAHGD